MNATLAPAPAYLSVSNHNPISILLIDDHAIVRVGFKTLLAQQDWCGTITEADNGEAGYHCFRELNPDVIVMDLTMPKMSGITAIQRIKAVSAEARILVVSVHDETVFVMQAMKAGAAGYVSKASAPEELVVAVRTVADGKPYISNGMAQRMVITQFRGESNPFEHLSSREFEIVSLATSGVDPREIAARLSIHYKTVVNYLTQTKRKLNVANATELTKLAIRHGIIDVLPADQYR
ncbi:MAG: response regulator transcription factor [Gammaproteobacteria bacterium]|nr:response regulator transcription factor [Gammaproteobacteria bacterium]